MIRLIIFAITMLLLSAMCNGQGRTSFGATRAQDTSFTQGQLKLNAYTDADTSVLITTPGGIVKKLPLSDIGGGVDADTLLGYMEVVTPEQFLSETSNDTGLAVQYALNYIQGVREVSFVGGTVTLDSVAPARSAILYLHSRVYRLTRALVKTVIHPTLGSRAVNSQLYIPLIAQMSAGRKANQIVIQGESQPTFFVNYLNAAPLPSFTREPVLYSTINNDASTFPALLRAVPGTTISPFGIPISQNVTELYIDKVTFRVHHDTALGGTQLCGVDLYNTPNSSVTNFRIDADFDNYYTVTPSFNVFGIRSGVTGTGNNMIFSNGVITGAFLRSAVGYEHSIWRDVSALVNYYAFESAAANYDMILDNCGAFGNKVLIHSGAFQISSAAGENAFSGSIRAECNTQGKWYDRDVNYDVVDPGNLLKGKLNYYITVNGGPVDTIRVNGGANLQLEFASSLTTGKVINKYPGNIRETFGGGSYEMNFNNNGATPLAQTELKMVGNALGMNLFVKNALPAGFSNIILENDRATGAVLGLIQLGGSEETQPNVFGRTRRDVFNVVSSGSLNRGINIGNLTFDSVVIGTFNNPYAWLTPTGNWQFAPPTSFLIYNGTNKLYNMGFGTTTPATIGGQVTTDRRVSQDVDSARVMHRVITGTGGSVLDMIDLSATAGRRRLELANINGVTSLLVPNDAGTLLTSTYLQGTNSNGYILFGSGTPTSKVDVLGANGYNQFRMRTSYTPTGTADANGNTGDMAWDADYIYIKTGAGWKRTALSTF